MLLGFLAPSPCSHYRCSVGIFCGANQGHLQVDQLLMSVNNLNLAVPSIVSSPILILIFAVALSWFPAGGALSFQHYILPATALGLPFSAAIARLMRGSLIESKSEPHIMTARSKGLNESRIILVHCLPSAMIPILSFLGPAAASLITGSVVVEQIFDLQESAATSCKAQ